MLLPCLSRPSALCRSNANMHWSLASRLSSSKRKAICWLWRVCAAYFVCIVVEMLGQWVASASWLTIFISSKCHSSSSTIYCTWSIMPKYGRSTMNFLLMARRRTSMARSSVQTRCTCTSTPARTPSASLPCCWLSMSSSRSYFTTTMIKSLLASMKSTTRTRRTTTWTWSGFLRRWIKRSFWSATQWSISSSMRTTRCTRSMS